MREQFVEKIKAIYTNFYSNIFKVYDIFKEFYGEDRVDLQNILEESDFVQKVITTSFRSLGNTPLMLNFERPELLRDNILERAIKCNADFAANILIHFPHLTVTNEENRSVDVQDLYIKVNVTAKGTMDYRFTVNRSTYPFVQFYSKYLHSHVPRINYNEIAKFNTSCLGSGPILETSVSLNDAYDENIWKLFCIELSKYLEVESLEGVPYFKMQNIGKVSNREISTDLYPTSVVPTFGGLNIKNFVSYILKKEILHFNFINDNYSLGMSTHEAFIAISNCFIDWYNENLSKHRRLVSIETLLSNNLMVEVTEVNNSLYYKTEDNNKEKVLAMNGTKLFSFKGKDVVLNIIDSDKYRKKDTSFYILHPSICEYIITALLNYINCKYGKYTDESDKKSGFFV